MALSVLGFSVPTFWIGMLLIMAFAVELGWLPSGGRGDEVARSSAFRTSLATATGWSHVILPAINLSLFKMGLMIRLARAGMVEAMQTDYVKFARAQGLPDRQIVFRHVLRNISIPDRHRLRAGTRLDPGLRGGDRNVFNWPGVGKLIIDSILQLDRPVMVTYLILVVLLFVIINFIVDLVYARLDPRVRLGGSHERRRHDAGNASPSPPPRRSRPRSMRLRNFWSRLQRRRWSRSRHSSSSSRCCCWPSAHRWSRRRTPMTWRCWTGSTPSCAPGTVGSGGYVHLLGTDNAGRDMLSAILYGLRTSFIIGLCGGRAGADARDHASA